MLALHTFAPDDSFVGAACALDHRVVCWAQATCTGPWLTFARAVTFLGSGWMVLPVVLASLAPGRFARLGVTARALLLVTGVTSGLVALLKMLVQRPRPFRAYSDVMALVAAPSDYSLPSGHAAGAFVVATFITCALAYSGARARHVVLCGAALGLVAAMVAASRVVLGVHFPIDVTLGALFGMACGVVGAREAGRRSLIRRH